MNEEKTLTEKIIDLNPSNFSILEAARELNRLYSSSDTIGVNRLYDAYVRYLVHYQHELCSSLDLNEIRERVGGNLLAAAILADLINSFGEETVIRGEPMVAIVEMEEIFPLVSEPVKTFYQRSRENEG